MLVTIVGVLLEDGYFLDTLIFTLCKKGKSERSDVMARCNRWLRKNPDGTTETMLRFEYGEMCTTPPYVFAMMEYEHDRIRLALELAAKFSPA